MPGERKAIEIVQDLIRDCFDARQSYRYAAEHASEHELRALFSEQCVERGEFASQLEQIAARELGEIVSASVRSGRRRLPAPKHPARDKELLDTIEKREALSRKMYEEALQQDLPDDLPGVVSRQVEAVKAAHDHLRLMRQRMSRDQAA